MRGTHLPDELWWSLVDNLDAGILVFDASGVVIYANDAAGDLLDYPAMDALGLDLADFLALCQPDRLEIEHLRADLLGNASPTRHAYAVTTATRRLSVRIQPLSLADEPLLTLILRPLAHWRMDLIAEMALNDLHSPLAFAAGYVETLLQRLSDPSVHAYELRNFARISLNSLKQAGDTWEMLRRLELTGGEESLASFEAVDLRLAIQDALTELTDRSVPGLPDLPLDLPEALSPVSGSPRLLHIGLCALLEGMAVRLPQDDRLILTVQNRGSYVQVEVIAGSHGSALQAYLFDELPFAIAEQAIIQHGGRIWIDSSNDGMIPVCCFSLPVWTPDD